MPNKKTGGQILSLTIFAVLIVITLVFALLGRQSISNSLRVHTAGGPTPTPKKSLQLRSFNPYVAPTSPPATSYHPPATPSSTCGIGQASFTTIDPMTGKCCVADGPAETPAGCCRGVGAGYDDNEFIMHLYHIDHPFYWCDAKPVIYLYPEKPTNVNVKIKIPGQITKSIPQISANEWKNITAYPGGKLFYDGGNYNELFYETAQEKTAAPNRGFVVGKKDLEKILVKMTSDLGLNSAEQSEFLSYWLVRLNELPNPYVFVSVFPADQKDLIDDVQIIPRPDVFINFIMYFKGVDEKYDVEPISLPDAPRRAGFIAVEWGGILDTSN